MLAACLLQNRLKWEIPQALKDDQKCYMQKTEERGEILQEKKV